MRLAMGRKITMARNPWKVLALGSLHAHPPRGHGVPAFPGRRDRALAGRAAQATASRRTRGGGVHLVVPGRPGPGGERHSGTSVSVLSAPLGAADARRGRARPDATRPALPRDGAVLRGGRHGRGLGAVPGPALRRHPRALALFGWAAQRARPAALVTTFYGVEVRWVKTAMPFLKGFLRWAARRSDRVVAISSYTAEEVRQLVQVPIEVIPYTTSLPAPAPRAGRRAAAAPFTVLFVGRLVERKGVSHLVDAVSVLRSGVDVRLVIVGDGAERARIEARVREHGLDGRVAVRGRVSEAELQAAYAAADAFVLPAVVDRRGDTEGLGVVLLEAMNHRVPVIASASGGITDIVEDGVSGLLVPPGDARARAAGWGGAARRGAGGAGARRTWPRAWETPGTVGYMSASAGKRLPVAGWRSTRRPCAGPSGPAALRPRRSAGPLAAGGRVPPPAPPRASRPRTRSRTASARPAPAAAPGRETRGCPAGTRSVRSARTPLPGSRGR